ncbi:MAG: hypothetical protein ACI392_05495 [Paludibacteraceae bacterium]
MQWMVDGALWQTTQVNEGAKATPPTGTPTVPTSCSEKVFVGWSSKNIGTTPTNDPGNLFTDESPNAINGDSVFYAVFATETTTGGGEATYDLVTTAPTDWSGTYIISTGDYVVTGQSGSNSYCAYSTHPTSVNTAYEVEIAPIAGTEYYSIYHTSGGTYLGGQNSTTMAFTTTEPTGTAPTSGASYHWSLSTSGLSTSTSSTRKLCVNTSASRFSMYVPSTTYIAGLLYKKSGGSTTTYSDYVTQCCNTTNTVSLNIEQDTINLDSVGNATTTITATYNGNEGGTFTVTSNGTELSVENGTPYTFTAKAKGQYVIVATYNEGGCPVSVSATITVLATPIVTLTATDLNFTASCGEASDAQKVTVKGYYLTGDVTVSVATGTNIEISSDSTNFYTSVTVTQAEAEAEDGKEIFVRVTPPADSTDGISGTLTATSSGAENKSCTVNATVTCGTSIRLTATDAESTRITAVKDQWTRTRTPIKIKGSYLTNDASAVTLTLTSSNANFKFVDSQTTGAGSESWQLTNITTASLDTAIYIVYTPTAYDQLETATITAKITKYGTSTEYATGTIEVNGRSLPETFVLALYTGSQWVALPADMIAPYGGSAGDCTTGVGTHDPYPITVNEGVTRATLAPARAIYKGAARNTPTTNPWTSQFESNMQTGYYLFGSVDGTNPTYIGNVTYEESDRVKWALMSNDLETYRLHQYKAADSRNLGYNGTSGNNAMGQYTNTASGYVYDFRILPVDATCTYYIKPVMTYNAYDATNSTIAIPYDGTTNYEYSIDGGSNWTEVTGSINCKTLLLTFANSTVAGNELLLRPQGTLCEDATSETAIHMLKPTIVASDQTFTATSGVAFAGNFGITLTDIWTGAGGGVTVKSSNAAITASLSGSTVTVNMAAASADTYTTQLTFSSVGAAAVTITVTINVQDLATLDLYLDYDVDGVVCQEAIYAENPIITWDLGHNDANANLLYKDGSQVTATSVISNCVALYDVTEGNTKLSGLTPSISSVPQVYISSDKLQLGHTYRFEFTNNEELTDAASLRYADAAMEFQYIRCDIPTALPACPVTANGFTANWSTEACSDGNVTVDVYTKNYAELLNKTTFSTIEVKSLQYAGETNLSGDYWITNVNGTATGNPSISSDRLLLSDVSTPNYYNLFSPLLSNFGTISKTTTYTITVSLYQATAGTGCGVNFYVMSNGSALAKNTTPDITDKSVTIDGATATTKCLAKTASASTETYTFSVTGLENTDRLRFLGYESSSIASSSKNVYISSIKIEATTQQSQTGYPKSVTCSAGTLDVSGLSSGTQYYYTVSDGTNTSNEVAVTTRTAAPALKLYADEACTTELTETIVRDGEPVTVYVKGTNLTGCNLDATVSNTCYTLDKSSMIYVVGSGTATGSLVLSYNGCANDGLLTVTDGTTSATVALSATDCTPGIKSAALDATSITDNSATAKWNNALSYTGDKSGQLIVYKDGSVNRNLIENGDFEAGTYWTNGIAGATVGDAHSFDGYVISTSVQHGGSYSVYVSKDGLALTNFNGSAVLYGDYVTLQPGTYTFSCWIYLPNAEGYSDKKMNFSLGLISGSSGSEKVEQVSTTTEYQTNATWNQLSWEFTLTKSLKVCPSIGGHADTFRPFYVDDVELKRTEVEMSEDPYLIFDIADLTAGGSLDLTGLEGYTQYSYIIQDANGCSSDPIHFSTLNPGDPTLSADDVVVVGPVGETTYGTFLIEAANAYADILLTNSCGTSPINLLATKVSQDGGVVQFAFTPTSDMTAGETGTCTISMITSGMTTPDTMNITWTVSAGTDPNAPLVEVVDISTTTMSIDHNVAGEGTVRIVLNRELTEEEKTENVGDEIFFSKYYEAYMHKKLWAIYNPTNDTISLAGTEVWRSSDAGAWFSGEDKRFDLSEKGRIKPGCICPNEEIIVYTADQVGTCEQSKADMSEWTAGSSGDQPLSFSGDDALVLVRNTEVNDRKVTTSVDGTSITWRTYDDTGNNDRGTSWLMLDLIGARKADNTPDLSAASNWSWTNYNVTPSVTEKGDAKGWWRHDGFSIDGTQYKEGGDQTPVINEGYLLSTNRCLLIRRQTVKSGAAAVQANVGDMVTLGGAQCEWRGKHVPTSGDQDQVSCDNFAFVGGYDYDNYYNSWMAIDGFDSINADRNIITGDYDITDFDNQQYKCHDIRIEVVEKVVVDGIEVDNIKAYTDYRVPIVVEGEKMTDDSIFQSRKYTYGSGGTETFDGANGCKECDVVVRPGAKLSSSAAANAKTQFRNMYVYQNGKLELNNAHTLQLEYLEMRAVNDTVSYAIVNNSGGSITTNKLVHVKRINDQYWYPFSLPYDCKVATIRQYNGKGLGEYGTKWVIKYYDGEARNADQNPTISQGVGGSSSYWKVLPNDETLKANVGYIIGFDNDDRITRYSVYFTPVVAEGYTESATEDKSVSVQSFGEGASSDKQHWGWNNIGQPFISIFNGTVDASSVLQPGEWGSGSGSTVYLSVPDGGSKRTYTQFDASTYPIEPFKAYFVQVKPNLTTPTLNFGYASRTLTKAVRATGVEPVRLELNLTAADGQTDNAGVVVGDEYAAEYEIGDDLVKLYAQSTKPQLFSRNTEGYRLAYNALPTSAASCVPLGIYAPAAGQYTISLDGARSQYADVEAVSLLCYGEIVADLLLTDYTFTVSARGELNDYSLNIQRAARVTTPVNVTDDADAPYLLTDGHTLRVEQLPTNCQLQLTDAVGRVVETRTCAGLASCELTVPVSGVYMVLLTNGNQKFILRTIVK